MSVFSKVVEAAERALREMDTANDQTQLRSNRMALQLELDGCREKLEAWESGKPLLPYFPSSSLARALGSLNIIYADAFLNLRLQNEAPKYVNYVRKLGIPDYMCDVLTLPNAAAIIGDLPPTSLGVVCSQGSCRVWPFHLKVLAEHSDAPIFEIDTPQIYSEESIVYLGEQLRELVIFAEKHVPGLHYDEDKHLELIEANRIWVDYCVKNYDLMKNVPLPVSNKDVTRVPYHFEPAAYPDSDKVLEYWRVRTEEIQARVDAGVQRQERLRVLWITPPMLYVNPMEILDGLGVSVPAVALPPDILYYGLMPNCWGDDSEFGRRLSPFEEEARAILGASRLGEGLDWGSAVSQMCQDLHCDAAVFFQFTSCSHYCSLAQFVAEELERRLGIPTLILPTKNFDQSLLPPDQMEARLAQFVDVVETRKRQ